MARLFFIHSSIHGHVGCPHLLATASNAAVHTGAHMFLETLFSVLLGTDPEAELRDHMVILFLTFQETTILLSTAAATIFHAHQQCTGFRFLHTEGCFYDGRSHGMFVCCQEDRGRSTGSRTP